MCINTTQQPAQFTQGNEKLRLNSQQFQFAPNSQRRFHQASERLLQNSSKSRKDEADERKHVPDSHRGFADQSRAPHGARGSTNHEVDIRAPLAALLWSKSQELTALHSLHPHKRTRGHLGGSRNAAGLQDLAICNTW